MALPQAVLRQAEEAEALQKQVYPQGQELVEESTEPPAEVPAPSDEAPTNVVELPKPAEPVQEVAPPPVAREETVEYWRDRFKTVQGKLDAELPQLHQRLREQDEALRRALSQIEEQKKPAQKDASSDLITDKDTEDYGADLVDMVRRAAREEGQRMLERAMAEFRKEIGAVESKVGEVGDRVSKSDADKFWASVMSLVPDWPVIDADESWFAFLDTTPEFSDATYRELAGRAIQKGDAQKIANLVGVWRKAVGRFPAQPQPSRPNPQAELQRQVAPNTAKTGTSAPAGERIWSRDDYEAAMDHRNVRRLGQAEADRLEAEANRAVAEGRVRW